MRSLSETTAPKTLHKRACGPPVVSPVARENALVCSQNASSPHQAIPRVCVLGREYTTLKWYLGKKTNDSQLSRVTDYGFTRALELWGGDSKTLMAREFVSSTAAQPPELLPSRQNLPSDWVETACPTMRGRGKEFVWAQRAPKPSNFRQILLPCDELAQVFKTKSHIVEMRSRRRPPTRQAQQADCPLVQRLASQTAKGRAPRGEVGPGPGPSSPRLCTIWDSLLSLSLSLAS